VFELMNSSESWIDIERDIAGDINDIGVILTGY
jgi:hypothetical protein